MFTDTSRAQPDCSQPFASPTATSNTYGVGSCTNPLLSAKGTNSDGGSRSSTGCCQRTSASTPTTRRGGDVDLRLVLHE